jgi:hypothetical protein
MMTQRVAMTQHVVAFQTQQVTLAAKAPRLLPARQAVVSDAPVRRGHRSQRVAKTSTTVLNLPRQEENAALWGIPPGHRVRILREEGAIMDSQEVRTRR